MQIQDDKPYDEINITPMLDLAYVLLVIFILMTTATVQGIKANLPRGSNAPKKQTEKNKVKAIAIDNSGNIFFDLFFPEILPSGDPISRPDGPGADSPLTGWLFEDQDGRQFNYLVTLTGAEAVTLTAAVPEPASFVTLGVLLACAGVGLRMERRPRDAGRR